MNAITSNRAIIFYYLSQLIILHNDAYREVERKRGKQAADRLLTDTLLVFHRQVKFNKVVLVFKNDKVLVSRDNQELLNYLSSLFLLIVDTSPGNPFFEMSRDFETRLLRGQGFHKLVELKGMILNTLYTCGCKDQQDREEIFDESLLLLWKKISLGEVGIFFAGNSEKLENCRVFHRKFYQASKLSTFLAGISKNLFLNKTRTAEYRIFRNNSTELVEEDADVSADPEPDSPALLLFMFYRYRVEQRKLRTIISLLQYDCNLEDKEVRMLIGINNARIHSSRLRANFSGWYLENRSRIPELLDSACFYQQEREKKKEKLNRKIRVIDLYQRGSLSFLDLKVFREEFQSIPEFRQHYLAFRNLYYLVSTGKPSALSGLPDEKQLRILMEKYKSELFSLPRYKAILLLLFYGSDEPGEIIIRLLKELCLELQQQNDENEPVGDLTRQLQDHAPGDETELTTEIYTTNQHLFSRFTAVKNVANSID